MKSLLLIPACVACAVAGWLLPPLWMPEAPPVRRKVIATPKNSGIPESFAAKAAKAGTPMAQFQAIVKGVTGHGRALLANPAALSRFNCSEAEELALRLAGEELAGNVTDGAAFLASLKDMNGLARAAALDAWADRDPDGALRALVTPPGVAVMQDDNGGDNNLIQRLVERDPEKALRILQTAGAGARQAGWKALLETMAKTDSKRALDALLLAPRFLRNDGIRIIAQKMMEKDARAALAWRESLSPELKDWVSLPEIISKLAESEPLAAMDFIRADPPEADDWDGEPNVSGQWALKDPREAIRWACENAGKAHLPSYISSSLEALVKKSPAEALEVFGTLKGENRQVGIKALATAWAETDVTAALAWSRSLEGEERATALRGLGHVGEALPEAEKLALGRELGVENPDGFRLLWMADHAAAVAGFEAMPPEARLETWGNLNQGFFLAHPEDSTRMMKTILEAGDSSKDVSTSGFSTFMGLWAQRDPNAAAAGAKSLPVDFQVKVLPEIASSWVQRDPGAASAWLKGLPEGEGRTLATRNIIDYWSRHDPETAAAFTLALPDAGMKGIAAEVLSEAALSAGDEAASMRWRDLTAPAKAAP